MRKIIAIDHISLDGVIQSPGAKDEDTEDGFALGGWVWPYSDDLLDNAVRSRMEMPFDLLMGRKTYDIWAPYWPKHDAIWPAVNTATKYVASNTLDAPEWGPTVVLSGDIVPQIHDIKRQTGPDLHVYGSANLLQTLLQHDLVDALWLMIYPLTLGPGKRLFAEGALPAEFKLTEGVITPTGVILASYERAGG